MNKKILLLIFITLFFFGRVKGEEEGEEESDEGYEMPKEQTVDLELNVPNQSFRKSFVVNLNDDEVVSFGPIDHEKMKKKKKLKKLKKLMKLI